MGGGGSWGGEKLGGSWWGEREDGWRREAGGGGVRVNKFV